MTPANSDSMPGPGVVTSVNLSPKKGMRKTRGTSATLELDRGFENDAHAGDWHRQVSLLAQESIDTMVAKGLDVGPGDFAENITTSGIDLLAIVRGDAIVRDEPPRLGDQHLERGARGVLGLVMASRIRAGQHTDS